MKPITIVPEAPETESDRLWKEHIRLYPMDKLEVLQNAAMDYTPRGEYGYLKEYANLQGRQINLEELRLTDKQLAAVSLVFYGGVTKKRAATAMKITCQSLDTHIKAALKKISHGFL